MHVDFVEEAYWKRCAAKKFAAECASVAIHKAKLRSARQQRTDLEDKQRAVIEEQMRQENLKREEERRAIVEKREQERNALREARMKAEEERVQREKDE